MDSSRDKISNARKGNILIPVSINHNTLYK